MYLICVSRLILNLDYILAGMQDNRKYVFERTHQSKLVPSIHSQTTIVHFDRIVWLKYFLTLRIPLFYLIFLKINCFCVFFNFNFEKCYLNVLQVLQHT